MEDWLCQIKAPSLNIFETNKKTIQIRINKYKLTVALYLTVN